ncbi:MAG: phage head-tail adapter protein [Clostridiales bacterium]|nr:phage head-tail adapter protein [Clostridiales bacterium]
MNREWSELNKKMQVLLKKRDSFEEGVDTMIELRDSLMATMEDLKTDLARVDLDAMPFINADGYHSKNIAYSIWHIMRIEDIVAHTLIADDEQIFFAKDYQKRTGSPIITTGNELVKEEISGFTSRLDIDELYSYASDVKSSTEKIIKGLSYDDLKMKIPNGRKERLISLNVVSTDESAEWLIDYWCGKDIRGLIQMPFSRHWIMHIEASLRIKNKIRP